VTRLLILCTHNSARSQMAEGWVRHHAVEAGLKLEVWSAGTEKTRVKPEAVIVMREVGIDLSGHRSKTLDELADPWNFDVVLTVCDSANEACPAYPAKTKRLHVSFPDPSGHDLAVWRDVRDALGGMSYVLVKHLKEGETFSEGWLEEGVETVNPLVSDF
jgi:arsenate reductase (thioredoxin)